MVYENKCRKKYIKDKKAGEVEASSAMLYAFVGAACGIVAFVILSYRVGS
jgi:hypothetical protein